MTTDTDDLTKYESLVKRLGAGPDPEFDALPLDERKVVATDRLAAMRKGVAESHRRERKASLDALADSNTAARLHVENEAQRSADTQREAHRLGDLASRIMAGAKSEARRLLGEGDKAAAGHLLDNEDRSADLDDLAKRVAAERAGVEKMIAG